MDYQTYEVTDGGEDHVPGPRWRAFQWPIIAACIAGMPFILSFPSQLHFHGGGAFLVPLCILAVFVMGPLIFVQLKLGSKTDSNIITMFGRSIPILKGVGIAMMLYQAIVTVITQVTLAMALVYAFYSLKSDPLPWSHCSNAYNTPLCRLPRNPSRPSPPQPGNVTITVVMNGMNNTPEYTAPADPRSSMFTTPATEYNMFAFLQGTANYGEMGSILPYLTGSLALLWLVTFLLVCWGPRVFSYVVMVLAIGSFTVIFLLIGRGHQALPELAAVGFDKYYTPNWDMLKTSEVWGQAFAMGLMLMGVLSGALPTFGKLVGPGCCASNTTWIAIIAFGLIIPNLLVIMLSPFISMLAVVFANPHAATSHGMKIAFVDMPDVAVVMDSGVMAFLFFLWMLLQGLMHQSFMVLVLLDCVVEGFKEVIQKVCHRKFVARILIAAILCLCLFLVGLPFVFQGGLHIIHVVRSFLFVPMPLLYLLAVIAFIITYAKQTRLAKLERILVLVVFGVLSVMVVLLLSYRVHQMVKELPLVSVSGRSKYPKSSNIAGWMVAIVPLAFSLIAGILHAYITANGNCAKRLIFLFKGAPVPRRRKVRTKEGLVSMRPVGGLSSTAQEEPLVKKSTV